MITNRDIMDSLERIRLERKIAIKDLVCDITSRRNYSRFLSDEINISLEVLSKLLNKLNIPFSEFSFYMYNLLMYENINEVYFHELIRKEKYEEAYQKYYPLIQGKQWKTLYSGKTIPIGTLLMKSKLRLISDNEALREMTQILNLENIIGGHIIDDDDIEAMFLYIRICGPQEKEKISAFAYDALTSEKYMKLTGFYEQTITILQLIGLKTLTTKAIITNEDRKRINELTDIALKFHNRTRMGIFDIMLFQTLYEYIKANNIENKYVVFYYVASIIGSFNEDFVKDHKYAIAKADINVFYEYLNEEDFIESNMYERLLANGIM